MEARHGVNRRPGFRPDVEGLRALAVILVMLYHAGISLVGGGFAGVDVFFVVSGFVITQVLAREVERTGTIKLLAFFGRRARRLLPAAGLVLVATALMSWLWASRVHWASISGDIVAAAAYLVNWRFSARSVDYLAEDVEPSPVLHFWSLAVEEQFYLIWPVLIIGLGALAMRLTGKPPRRAFLALGLSVVVLLPSFGWAMWQSGTRPESAFFVTTTRLWELAIGALVALGVTVWRRIPRPAAGMLAWAGVTLIVLGALFQTPASRWPAPGALLPTLGTAAVIIGGAAAGRGGPRVFLASPVLVWIGALSYSLYLWHWPLLQFAQWRWGELSAGAALLVVAFSFLPAWLSYHLVEQPIRHSARLSRSPGLALTVGLNASVIAVVAGLALMHAPQQAPVPQVGLPPATTTTTSTTTSAPTTTSGDPSTDPEQASSGGSGEPGGSESISQGDSQTVAPTAQAPTADVPPPDPGGAPLFDTVTPDPAVAVQDVPWPYAQGCITTRYETVVRSCSSGDPDGEVVIAVVGDSKIVQWLPALDRIAEENGWLLRLHAKEGCAYVDADVVLEDGAVYTECAQWRDELSELLLGDGAVDAVITSSVRSGALEGQGQGQEPTVAGLAAGYERAWAPLIDSGTTVIVLSDTPFPGLADPVYECVANHPQDYPAECSWSYTQRDSSAAMQQAAAQVGATFIDMDPWVCPNGVCSPTYRNVLTYRQGSHITATFAAALTEPLAGFLVPVVQP